MIIYSGKLTATQGNEAWLPAIGLTDFSSEVTVHVSRGTLDAAVLYARQTLLPTDDTNRTFGGLQATDAGPDLVLTVPVVGRYLHVGIAAHSGYGADVDIVVRD